MYAYVYMNICSQHLGLWNCLNGKENKWFQWCYVDRVRFQLIEEEVGRRICINYCCAWSKKEMKEQCRNYLYLKGNELFGFKIEELNRFVY